MQIIATFERHDLPTNKTNHDKTQSLNDYLNSHGIQHTDYTDRQLKTLYSTCHLSESASHLCKHQIFSTRDFTVIKDVCWSALIGLNFFLSQIYLNDTLYCLNEIIPYSTLLGLYNSNHHTKFTLFSKMCRGISPHFNSFAYTYTKKDLTFN